MTSTQRGLAGACCVASAVLALLMPGILHHPTSHGSTTALGAHALPGPARGGTTGQPTSSISGIPVGQQSNVQATPQPPVPVGSLALVANTWTSGTVAWTGTTSRYRVLVDGHLVREGAGDTITLRWPQDGSNLLVQVAPIDQHGRLGQWRSLVVVPVRAGSSSTHHHSHHDGTSTQGTTGQGTTGGDTTGRGTAGQSSAQPQAPASTVPSTPAGSSATSSAPTASSAPTSAPSAGQGTGNADDNGDRTDAGDDSGTTASSAPREDTPHVQVNNHVGSTDAGSGTTTTATATPVADPAN